MVAPQTGFESTGDWTTIEDESVFLAQIAADNADVTVATVGLSTFDGDPLHRATIDRAAQGSPVVLLLGGVHGNEPAGREAALTFVRDLAYSADPDMVELLAQAVVVAMPTVNPNGRRLNRRSVTDIVNGVTVGTDPNRDYLNCVLVETRVVHDAIAEYAPVVVVDLHEYLSPSIERVTAETLVTTNPNVNAGIKTLIDGLEASAWSGWDGDGYPYAQYSGLEPNPSAGWNFGALLHAVTITAETPAHPDTAVPPAVRMGMMASFTRSLIVWVNENLAAITQACADARAWASTRRPVFDLSNGTILDPAPFRYESLTEMPDVLSRHGVTGSLSAVTMRQRLSGIIPYILDHRSTYAQTDATPVGPWSPGPTPEGKWTETLINIDGYLVPVTEAWFQDGDRLERIVLPDLS